jgi:hypothetical protein
MGIRVAKILLAMLLSIALSFSAMAMPGPMARPAPQSMTAMSGKAMPCAHAGNPSKAHPCCPNADTSKQVCNSPCCASLPPQLAGFHTAFTLVPHILIPAREAALSDRITRPPSRPPKF